MWSRVSNSLMLHFFIPISILMVVLVVIGTTVVGVTYRDEYRSILIGKGDLITDLLSGSVAKALWELDKTGGEDILKALAAADSDYVGSVILDAHGDILAKNGLLPEDTSGVIVEKRPVFHVNDGKTREIGSIEIRLTPKNAERLWATHLTTLVFAAFAAISIIGAVLLAIANSVAHPIRAITRAMTSLSGGALDTAIPALDRKDEIGAMAAALDVFKRNAAETRRLETKLKAIMDTIGEGIVGLDGTGKVTFANRMSGVLLARRPEDMVGYDFCTLAEIQKDGGEEDGQAGSFALTRAYRDGLGLEVKDDIFRRSDGTPFQSEYLATPIFEKQRLAGAVVVFRDATLRLQYEAGLANQQRELERQVMERTAELRDEIRIRARTEEALRASQKRLKAITDTLFEGVLVVNHDGNLAFANPSARRMLECDHIPGDIEGYPLDDLMLLREGTTDIGFRDSPWRRVITEGLILRDDDAVFVLPAGSIGSVAYACSPLGDGELRWGAVISFRDIDALKQAQRDALQSSRLATVGQLAAGIAHEINTPIQYIGDNLLFIGTSVAKLATVIAAGRALAVVAADYPPTADSAARFEDSVAAEKLSYLLQEVPASIGESRDGVAQIARIVLSMKEFSHPGTNAKTTTDINHALETTLTVSHAVWKTTATIEKDFDPSLPPILCHTGELNQVFLNIIVNAVHAIEASGKKMPGRIAIATSHADGFVSIRIADSGTGIPAALRDKIFDPFFTTKDVGKGTGQGLAICRDVVVTKHGGTIAVDGREHEGAIFTIRLPIEGGSLEANANG